MAEARVRTTTQGKLSSILEIVRAATSGAGHAVRYPAGSTLMMQGEPATDVHLIVSGAVKLVSTSPSGRDVTVGIRWPGWLLGISPVVLDVPHPCRTVTMVSSEIESVPVPDFRRLASRDSVVSDAVAWLLSWELAHAVRRASWQGETVRRRLELLLRDLAVTCGQPLHGGFRIPLPLTHQELADLIVASREKVSRAPRASRTPGGTERWADADDVVGLRRSCPRRIVSNIHASASS